MFVLFVLEQSIRCQIKYSTCNPKIKSMRAFNTELLSSAGPAIPYSNSLDELISQL